MPGEPTSFPLLGGVTLLERAINYVLGGLPLVDAVALSAPTPCQGWDVHTLLRHLRDSLDALHEAFQLGDVGLDIAPGPPGCPVASVRTGASRLLGACVTGTTDTVAIAGLPLTVGVIGGTGAIEIAVHGWDLTVACGHERPIPPDLADELFDLAPLLVGREDRPGRFAAPVPVSALAEPGDRLVAFLGRNPISR